MTDLGTFRKPRPLEDIRADERRIQLDTDLWLCSVAFVSLAVAVVMIFATAVYSVPYAVERVNLANQENVTWDR